MGNTVTTCTCCENRISDRLPWILDHALILKRMPTRTESQPERYKKEEDEEESSERSSQKEKQSEEEEEEKEE